MAHHKKSSGFTLVELSIVIIIIGFLIAGITAGKSLIEQARLNGVINEMQNYKLVYNNFVLKYDAVPGDMANASAFFPNCANGTCDGNGNGLIEPCGWNEIGWWGVNKHSNGMDDSTMAFRHLNLAGLISNAGSTYLGGWSCFPPFVGGFLQTDQWGGMIYPRSNVLSDRVLAMTGGSSVTSTFKPTPFDVSTNQICIFRDPFPVTNARERGGLTPEQAYNLDVKMDDGQIKNGLFTGFATGLLRSVDDLDTGANGCIAGGSYDMDQAVATCITCYKLN